MAAERSLNPFDPKMLPAGCNKNRSYFRIFFLLNQCSPYVSYFLSFPPPDRCFFRFQRSLGQSTNHPNQPPRLAYKESFREVMSQLLLEDMDLADQEHAWLLLSFVACAYRSSVSRPGSKGDKVLRGEVAETWHFWLEKGEVMLLEHFWK